jgi:hypothetical protein
LTKNDVGLNNVDNTSDATKNAASTTLTNKTIASPQITSTLDLADGAAIRFKEQVVNGSNQVLLSAPNNLAADYSLRLPTAQSVANQFLKNDGVGNLSWSSAGGGSGRNYLSDYYEGTVPVGTVVNGLTATGNRASNQTSFGASSTSLLTIANNGTNPLRQTGDYQLTHVGTGAAFIETPMFNLDRSDLGNAVVLSFDLTGNVLDGDYDVAVLRYNSGGTYQETISVAGNASSGTPASAKLPTGTTLFRGFFVASATATDFYSVRIRRLSGTATSSIQIDSLFVGPQSLAQAAVVTAFDNAVTPSSGWFVTGPTNVTTTVKQARIGTEAHLKYGIISTGTSAAFSELSINLPANLTVDTTAINKTSSGRAPVGTFQLTKPGVANHTGVVYLEGSAFVCRYLSSTAIPSAVANNSPANWDTTTGATSINIDILVPISQWSSGTTTLADRAVEEYAFSNATTTIAGDSDLTQFGYGPQGANFRAINSTTLGSSVTVYRTRFNTPILPTDTMYLEFNIDGNTWLPVGTGGSLCLNGTQNNAVIGMGFARVPGSATDIDVIFGNAGRNTGATYGAAGGTWSGITTWRWRLRKVSGGASVGFPISTSNLVDKNKIQKKTLASSVTATAGATVQIPSLTFNNLVVGKNYRLHMHGYILIFVNAVGGAFAAIHNGTQLALIYYEGVASASNRWMASGTTQLFTAAATTVTFQFANTSGPNGSSLSGSGLSWVILEELNDTDLSTSFT